MLSQTEKTEVPGEKTPLPHARSTHVNTSLDDHHMCEHVCGCESV